MRWVDVGLHHDPGRDARVDRATRRERGMVASAATQWYGGGAKILRYVVLHPIVLAGFVGVPAMLQVDVPPFAAMVPAH